MTAEAAVAVVVPARDAGGTLKACLAGLSRAGFREVVVVDDGSTDGTAKIAQAAGAHVRQGGGRGAAAARNVGARATAAPILLFVDADVVVAPDLRDALEASLAAHPDHAAVFGCYCADPPAPGLASRVRNLLHRHVHREGAGEAETFWTGLGAVRREAFDAVGGFDEGQRMMEDVAFGRALRRSGRRILLDPSLEGTHLKRWGWAGMVRTDLMDRAIPWSRLLLSEDGAGAALNVSREGRLSVLGAGTVLAGALGLVLAPKIGAAAVAAGLAAIVWANRGFLRTLRAERGAGFAAGAVPVLLAHYLAGGLGYAWVRLVERPSTASSFEGSSRSERGRSNSS